MLELRVEPGFAAALRPPCDTDSLLLARVQHLVSERLAAPFASSQGRAAPGVDIEGFARALIGANESQAHAALAQLADACGDARLLALDVLAPAARRLGEWWLEDECDFLEVSEALARLRAILAGLETPDPAGIGAPAMLLLTLPGETHRFGADVAADLFRREGWRVLRSDGDLAPLGFSVFDAVGISCGCERKAARLPDFLSEIKAMAGSRAPPVLLGGALFYGQSVRAESLGVEFVASDADSPRRITRALIQAGSVKPNNGRI